MKCKIGVILLSTMLMACGEEASKNVPELSLNSIQGTWQLVSGTVIEKGDTTITDYTRDKSFIKIINDTHFAFLLHDLTKGKDSAAIFGSGGGTYTLTDNVYTEHLVYCSDREWEGHDFTFTITIRGDSLIQQGIEKVESADVNRVNIEKYTKVKDKSVK